MKAVLGIALTTLLLVVVWVAVVFFGTSEGWWKRPLAPRGDTRAFMAAATRLVDAENTGNAVFALMEKGSVHAVHAVSIWESVDVNTVFQTASLSKWVTAWGVMALVEQGKLDLDAPISTYLTRWKLPASQFDNDKVTARRLLSHTAGLTDGLGYAGFKPGVAVQSLEASLGGPTDVSPGASGVIQVGSEPGSEWRYSGGGYAILQLLIEERSGESFEDYMQRVVFRPLGMDHSSYRWEREGDSTLATSYDEQSRPTAYDRFSAVAATSLYSSTADLTKFIQAHLPGENGERPGRGVLSPAVMTEMWRPHGSKFGEEIWGLGTMLYARNGSSGFVVGHDGSNTPAINTAVRFDPATGNGIVVLETGRPVLATTLAGEWIFWETGNVDFLAFTMAAPGMFRLMGIGCLVIVLAVPTAWWFRRRGRGSRTDKVRA